MLTKCVISPANLKIFMAFPRSNGEYSCPRFQRFSVCKRERGGREEGVEEGRNRIFVASVKRLREGEMTWQSETASPGLHGVF
jgi:hypothetical protein